MDKMSKIVEAFISDDKVTVNETANGTFQHNLTDFVMMAKQASSREQLTNKLKYFGAIKSELEEAINIIEDKLKEEFKNA